MLRLIEDQRIYIRHFVRFRFWTIRNIQLRHGYVNKGAIPPF